MSVDKKVGSTRSHGEPYQLEWEISSARGRRIQVRRDFYPPDHRYPGHHHDWAELLIVEHGTLLHAGDGWRQRLPRGSVALVPMGCIHELSSPPKSACVIVNLAVHAELAEALRLINADPLLDLLLGQGRPQSRILSSYDLVLCARMITEAAASEDHRLCLALLLFLLDRCAREEQGGRLPSALLEALDGLQEPCHLREGIAYLSRCSGYHPDHVTRLIKERYGYTAIELITQLRLDHLADRILHGDTPIGEICVDCGIANRTHANKRFKERYGCTPSELRRGRNAEPRGTRQQ